MPLLTNLAYWRVPLVLAWVGLMIFGKRKGRVVGILVILIVTIGDQVCNQIIKPWVGRVRPCNVLEGVHLLINCTQSYSFPSSHATNLFSSSFLFSYFYRRWTIVFLMIALLVSYSRIYVGVHYPLDILGGMVLGGLVSLVVLIAYRKLEKYVLKKKVKI
jgi:undecaprenyl-diphosphatase